MAASMSRTLHRKCVNYLIKHRLNYSSTPAANVVGDEDVNYPPVKPRYPPGKWGSTKEKIAWKRHDKMEEINEKETVTERVKAITEEGKRVVQFPSTMKKPNLFDLQIYSTKTHTIEGLPEAYRNVTVDPELLKRTKSLVEDIVLIEYDKQIRSKPKMNAMLRNKVLIRNLLNNLIPTLYKDNPGLRTARVDRDIEVKAFWERTYVLKDGGGHWNIDGDLAMHDWFSASYQNDYQIRTEFPLPEFVPIGDALCHNEDFPMLSCSSAAYGIAASKVKREVTPGYNPGDPCEFGLINFKNSTLPDFYLTKYDQKVLEKLKLAFGVMNSFTWLLSQAYFQGFHHLCDITYPLSTQTVLTDGKAFSFYAYQLNTIDLWKDNVANPYQNLCWFQKEENLYEKVEEGKVIGFNDEVCETLLKCLLLKPVNRGIDMKPTLPPQYHEWIEREELISREGLPVETEEEEGQEGEIDRVAGDFDQ